MQPSQKVWYNNGNGNDRDDDRIGFVLPGGTGGKVRVQTADSGPVPMEPIHAPLPDNRGACCWET